MTGSLARRYARALIQLAQETDRVEDFGKSLEKLAALLRQAPDVLHGLANELLNIDQRLKAVGEIADRAGYPATLKNFLSLLVKKERFDYLPAIVREYRRYQDELLGIVRVAVVTPKAPDAATLKRVASILGVQLKKTVVSRGEGRPEILGGMILKVNHTIYDGSVRRELEQIKEAMLKN